MSTTRPFGAPGATFTITSPIGELVSVFDDVLVDLALDRDTDDTDHRIDIDPIPAVDPAVDPTSDPDSGSDPEMSACSVRIDGEPVHDVLLDGFVVSHVLMELNRRVTEQVWANGSVALHASVVAGATGAVVLAGASHSGKTTLASALSLAGNGDRTFLADEVCALEPIGLTVAPYGKPAALRSPGTDLLAPQVERLRQSATRFERDERFVPPRELGGRAFAPSRVRAIVFPEYAPPAGTAGTTGTKEPLGSVAVGPVDALSRLMRLTLGTRPPDADTFHTLERLVRTVPIVELRYGDAIDAAGHLADLLEHGAPR
jgi:hypothetical protein